MRNVSPGFQPFAEKMKAEGLPEIAINTFEFYYNQLLEGRTGLIPERNIEPVESLPDSESFGEDLAEVGRSVMDKALMINLNGGLGTSMGLDKAKSLLKVKNGLSFLDIIAHQANKYGLPVVLMNSFATHDDSVKALGKYPELHRGIPIDFLQHKVPKIVKSTLEPVIWPDNEKLEWCPPGHGDMYTALVTSGTLDALLEAGYMYAFISNADNLGAVMDERILGFFVHNKIPFMMEAADRTEADRKGGHLARLSDGSGQLILRESAQCPEEDEESFQNVSLHKYFNTNTLWLNLKDLKDLMQKRDNILGLPMIMNFKTVDPRDPLSIQVLQLETAMGSAISVFKRAGAIRVPKTRFAPVKTCNELLAVRSDATILSEEYAVVPNPQRKLGTAVVSLDPRYYRLVHEMEKRFPYGPPSLIQCNRLEIQGDFKFGKNISLAGDVTMINQTDKQVAIPDNAVIEGLWKV